MVKVYIRLIKAGLKTLDEVPINIRSEVAEELLEIKNNTEGCL